LQNGKFLKASPCEDTPLIGHQRNETLPKRKLSVQNIADPKLMILKLQYLPQISASPWNKLGMCQVNFTPESALTHHYEYQRKEDKPNWLRSASRAVQEG
jgi:hypothetical protein